MQEEDLPTDYEGLLQTYKKLKEEFEDQNQVYEEYIASLENTKKDLEGRLQQRDKEQETFKKEIAKLKDANNDRNKDIEYLEKEVNKGEEAKKQLKEKLTKIENKTVEVELENTYYFNKIRELESWADELKSKLDAVLEENIILHNEHEAFKAECDEKIQRIQEELEDNKNEVLSKEKMIQKLTTHRDFLVRTATRTSEEIKHTLLKKITRTESMKAEETIEKPDNISSSTFSKKSKDKTYNKLSEDANTYNYSNIRIPDKFMAQLSQSITNMTNNKSENQENTITDNPDSKNNEKEFLIQKIQTEVKNIIENRKSYLLASLAQEGFSFDVLNIEGPAKLGKIKTAVQVNEAIDEVLMKIRERKDKIVTQKRLLQAKFEKLGIKIN